MRDLTRLASRIVMFFMQFYYRLARHSRVSYKAYIDGRTRLAGYNTIQDNVLLAGARIGRGTYICRASSFRSFPPPGAVPDTAGSFAQEARMPATANKDKKYRFIIKWIRLSFIV